MADGRHDRDHGVGDAGVGAALLDGADQIAAAEHADGLAGGIDHRELALAGLQQRLHRRVEMFIGLSVSKCVTMAWLTGTPRDSRAQRHHMRFRGGGEIDEDGDEDQDRIVPSGR